MLPRKELSLLSNPPDIPEFRRIRTTSPSETSAGSGPEQAIRKHNQLLEDVEREVSHALVQVDLDEMITTFFPDRHDIADAVTDHIESPKQLGVKWSSGKDEKPYYRPFVQLLNCLLIRIHAHIPSSATSYYSSSLRFLTWNKKLSEGADDPDAFKPYALGCCDPSHLTAQIRVSPICSKHRRHWDEISVVLEVKGDARQLRNQVLAYCRGMNGSLQVRWGIYITLQQTTGSLEIGVFRPDGVMYHNPGSVKSRAGLHSLARVLIGVLSWTDAWEAGRDPTRTSKMVTLSGLQYEEDSVLVHHNCVHGSGTVVQIVKWLEGPSLNEVVETGNKRSPPPDESDGPRRSKRLRLSREDRSALSAGASSAVSSPDSFEWRIVKDSWIPSGRCTDREVFGALSSKWGVPQVIDTIEVGGPERRLPSVAPLVDRKHTRTEISTIGLSLSSASSPSVLVEGVLHALIGLLSIFSHYCYPTYNSLFASRYWNLLEAGWLHCGVSVGNIMLLQTPVSRDQVMTFVVFL